MLPAWCQKNPHFTGRKNLLKILHDKLFDEKPEEYAHRVALYGLGGVGKTQLAIEYVVTHEHHYTGIYWITAVDQTGLFSGFQKIAAETGCATTELKPSELAREVLKWLGKQSGWLLVLDNLDDLSVAGNYLPRLRVGGGHLLITTRDPNAIGIPAEGLEVGVLDVHDAKALLLLRSNLQIDNIPRKQDIENEAIQIVEMLGFLALAIEQAAAYIREELKDIFKFMNVYSSHRKELHSRRMRGNWDYRWEVATTWLLSFEEIKKRNMDAARLLRLFAFLNPDGILVEFLEAGKDGVPEICALIGDSFLLNKALGELERFSLIRRPADGHVVSIHRLVQCVIKDEMAANDTTEFKGMVLGLCECAFPVIAAETRKFCQRYQGQVVGPLFEVINTLKTKRVADVMVPVAAFLLDDGKYGDCIRLLEEAYIIYTEVSGAEGLDTLTAAEWLALACRAIGRFHRAVELEEKVLEARQRIMKHEHPYILTTMNNLAVSYRNLGQTKEAAELEEKVLEAKQRILGHEHPDTLTTMNNLASSYRNLGRTKEAVELEEKVLEARQRILGHEHPDTLTTMNNLASSYRNLGRTKEAAELGEKVLEARQRILGHEHPDTLTTMNNLAASYQNLGRTKEAAELGEKVLEAKQRILGHEHPDTLMTMNNLAASYQDLGRTKEGAELEEKVLEARQRILGHEHPDTLMTMNNLAASYQNLGRTKEAAELEEKVLEARQRILGHEHPDTLTTMNNLAASYQVLGRTKEAAELEERVLEAMQRILGHEHPDTLTTMNNLASSYRNLGRTKEAAELEERVLEARQIILGHEHPDTLTTMNNLAVSYHNLGRTKEAAELEEKVVDSWQRILGDTHPNTLSAMGNLVSFFKKLGRNEEARKFQEFLNARKYKV
jgi:tetratricopeptide (TPR) repeat protein